MQGSYSMGGHSSTISRKSSIGLNSELTIPLSCSVKHSTLTPVSKDGTMIVPDVPYHTFRTKKTIIMINGMLEESKKIMLKITYIRMDFRKTFLRTKYPHLRFLCHFSLSDKCFRYCRCLKYEVTHEPRISRWTLLIIELSVDQRWRIWNPHIEKVRTAKKKKQNKT